MVIDHLLKQTSPQDPEQLVPEPLKIIVAEMKLQCYAQWQNTCPLGVMLPEMPVQERPGLEVDFAEIT